MALARVRLGWNPFFGDITQGTHPSVVLSTNDALTMDADEEEGQIIGNVYLAAGSGSKTFGGGSSALAYLSGASNTFQATATLRVGAKKSATIDDTAGPPGRATIGAAAFDVFHDLVGGTDTYANTTWRSDAMDSGTPFTVAHGDRIAICWHLDITSSAQNIKVRHVGTTNVPNWPCATLVTSGPTFTAQPLMPNVILVFSDGTIGWLEDPQIFTATSTEAVGNTNIYGNIWTPDVTCKVDAIRGLVTVAGTTAFDFGWWSDPNGTPTPITGANISVLPRNLAGTSNRLLTYPLVTETEFAAGTPYLLGVKQNSASAITVNHFDVANTAYHQINGLDDGYFAVKSTAGAAVASQASGTRRASFWFRVSQIHDGSGGGTTIAGTTLLRGLAH